MHTKFPATGMVLGVVSNKGHVTYIYIYAFNMYIYLQIQKYTGMKEYFEFLATYK